MPIYFDQITPKDLCAPKDHFRITCENMSDGELEIVADFPFFKWAKITMQVIRENTDDSAFIFILWDDQGKEVHVE